MADAEHDRSLPAHRPSRRADIVHAAVRQFARQGFSDTAIGDIADEADVVVTAVYYHFSSKEELFTAAINHVFQSISDVVAAARSEHEPGAPEMLDDVIDAVWSWIDEHPDEAALLYLQLPGATRQITALRQAFEDRHAQHAFGYFGDGIPRARVPAARRAADALAARTLVDLLISVQTMRLGDGPLSGEPGPKLRQAVHEVAARLVSR